MLDSNGRLCNFLFSELGERKLDIASSYPGGAWWSSRAKWALATLYRVTKKAEYLSLYKKIQCTEEHDNAVTALLLLAELELGGEGDLALIKGYVRRITSCMREGYFLHNDTDQSVHLWGYHQLEAIARAAQVLKDPSLLRPCISTINSLVKDAVANQYYYSFPQRGQEGLCAYCISPFVRGLYEVYRQTHDREVRDSLVQSLAWFKGNNSVHAVIYDETTGACLDGIHAGKVSTHAGAESAIEAGFCELRRVVLQKKNDHKSGHFSSGSANGIRTRDFLDENQVSWTN